MKKTEKVLDSSFVTILMTVITVYALFFDDLRVLFFDPANDTFWFNVSFVGMMCFFVEIFLGSIVKDDYFNTFFFWLDIISTVSMIQDIGWLWDPLIGNNGGNSDNAADLAKTTRAGRVTRVIRIIRLIRLIRIVKLYKQA